MTDPRAPTPLTPLHQPTRTATSDGGDIALPPSASAARSPRGAQVGRYTLLDEIGVGGMGRVFKAYDPELDRAVAVKLLLREGTGKTERLLREAQALARVNDPHVITVYEVGTHEGAPFIAMELAEGGTLQDFLRTQRSTAEIIDAFVEAGRGLAAVHRAGLVHRDFKPSNVLRGRDGRWRVADFGIVRATGEGHDVDVLPGVGAGVLTMSVTRTGALIGTPAYMAPEQAMGAHADMASDQFSFCVALYEGLCGARPSLVETLHGYDVVEPPEGAALPALLRRILVRGLSRARSDRWPSMQALLDALVHDPVRQRRRRVRAGLAAAVLVLGAGGAVLVPFALPQPCAHMGAPLVGVWDDAARDDVGRALQGSTRAHAASTWRLVQAALDRYAASWTAARTDACEATRVRGEQSEALLDVRMHCLDRRRVELLRLKEVLARADDVTVDHAVAAAGALTDLRVCADADALRAQRRRPTDDAQRAHREQIEEGLARAKAVRDAGLLRETLAVLEPVLLDARRIDDDGLTAEALLLLGKAYESLDNYKAAAEAFEESALRAEGAGDDRVRFAALLRLINVEGYFLDDKERAASAVDRARFTLRRLGEPPELRIDLLEQVSNLGIKQHDYESARKSAEEMLALRRSIVPLDEKQEARALRALARVTQVQGEAKLTLELLEPAVAAMERALGPNHPDLSMYLHNLALAHRNLGDLEKAVAIDERVIALWEPVAGKNDGKVGRSYGNLAASLHLLGRYDEALRAQQRALAIHERAVGKESLIAAASHLSLASTYVELRRFDDARRELDTAAAIHDVRGAKAERTGRWLVESALAHKQGDARAALAHLDRALTYVPDPEGADAANLIDPLTQRAGLLLELRRVDDAIVDARKALALLAAHPQGPLDQAAAERVLAQAEAALSAQGR